MYLYEIYKLLKQRSNRAPHNKKKSEMVMIARKIFEGEKTSEDIIEIAKKLKSIEIGISNIRTYFSVQILNAVESGNYSLELPYVIQHTNRDAGKLGRIYIFTSETKKGQVKLGATTQNPRKRVSQYSLKYGYNVNLYYCTPFLYAPFSLEKSIAEEISHLRIAANNYDDSIEWYTIEPEVLKSIILTKIKSKTL